MPEPDDPALLALLDPDGAFARRLTADRVRLATLAAGRHGGAARADAARRREMEEVAHRLAGAAGTFGYAALGAAAMRLEDLLLEAREAGLVPDRRSEAAAVAALLEALN